MILPDYNTGKLRVVAAAVNLVGSALFFGVSPGKIDRGKIKTVLIIKLDRIGDTFLATPTVEAIRGLFPTAEITVLCAAWNKDVLSHNPNIDCLKVFSQAPDVHKKTITPAFSIRRISALHREIKKLCPDMVIDLQGNPLIVLSAFWARVPIRVGFQRKLFSFLLTDRVFHSDKIHQSDVYFSIARYLGYKGSKPAMKIFLDGDENTERILRENHLQNFLVFHLGAGRSYRQWPVEHFADLANRIISLKPEIKIALIGSMEEQSLSAVFSKKADINIVNLIGKLTIGETYYLLSLADGFIGNESAPAHLSANTGTPTVMLMNEWSGIERWKALGEKVHIIRGKNRHHCQGIACNITPCPNMAAITVEEVLKVVENF